jgi:hypothetical protein
MKDLIKSVLEVAEHLQVDNGLLTATEQYDLGELLYCAVHQYEAALTREPDFDAQKPANMMDKEVCHSNLQGNDAGDVKALAFKLAKADAQYLGKGNDIVQAFAMAGMDVERYRNLAKAAMPKQGGWQTMESAPKDGVHYLGMIVGDRFFGEPFVCYYDEDEGHICLHPTEINLHRPTHWMHFPQPPVKAGEAE